LSAFKIGCLAWGSLVWDPRTLPRAGVFRDDGPWLPIEFSRIALDGRVTLIIDPAARRVRTHWVPLAVESLEEAVVELGIREKIAPEMRPVWVGRLSRETSVWPSQGRNPDLDGVVAAWLRDRALDAVVWTALPARGPDGETGRPELERLLRHLKSIEGEARIRAEEYIRRTPSSIATDHRAKFEESFGWISSEEGD